MPADTFTMGDRVRMVNPGACLQYQARVGHVATVTTSREADAQPDLVPIEFDDGEFMRVYPRRLSKVVTPAVGDVCIVTTHTIDGQAPGQPPIPDGAEVTVLGLPFSGDRLVDVTYADGEGDLRYRTIDIHQLTKKEDHMTVTTETQVSTYQPGDQAVVMRDGTAFTPGTIVTVADRPTFGDGVSVYDPGVTDARSVNEDILRPIRNASDIPLSEREGTLDERLGHAQVGDSVYITGYALRPHGTALTNPVTVLSVDRADAYQTFKVQDGQDEGAGIWWVYDVEKVESPEAETQVSDLAVGDRVRVTSPHLFQGNRTWFLNPIPVGTELVIQEIEGDAGLRAARVEWDGNSQRRIDLTCLTKVETPPQEPTAERDALLAENARLRAELSAELARQEAWFEEVGQIANSERVNNNWCPVYQSTMKDMGLGHLLPRETYTVTLTVTTPPGIEESAYAIERRILNSVEDGPGCSHDDENCTIRVARVERTEG